MIWEQEREIKHYHLLKGITDSLHREIDDSDYYKKFLEICQQLLVDLHEQVTRNDGTLTENPVRLLAWKMVLMPICTFTNDDHERIYLLTKAFKLIFDSATSGINGAYNYKKILDSTPNLA